MPGPTRAWQAHPGSPVPTRRAPGSCCEHYSENMHAVRISSPCLIPISLDLRRASTHQTPTRLCTGGAKAGASGSDQGMGWRPGHNIGLQRHGCTGWRMVVRCCCPLNSEGDTGIAANRLNEERALALPDPNTRRMWAPFTTSRWQRGGRGDRKAGGRWGVERGPAPAREGKLADLRRAMRCPKTLPEAQPANVRPDQPQFSRGTSKKLMYMRSLGTP